MHLLVVVFCVIFIDHFYVVRSVQHTSKSVILPSPALLSLLLCSQKDVPLKEQLYEALSQKNVDEEKVLQLVTALSEQNPEKAPAKSSKAGASCSGCTSCEHCLLFCVVVNQVGW